MANRRDGVVIRVVNKRTAGSVEPGVIRIYIGRPSPLGNPFVVGRDGSRTDVIRRYRTRIADRPNLVEPLWRISQQGDLELECWCSPLPCHGDVLKELIEELGSVPQNEEEWTE